MCKPSVGVRHATWRQPVTTFSTASRARRRRAGPLGRASLTRRCSGIARRDRAGRGGRLTGGRSADLARGATPQWAAASPAASALGGARRGRLPRVRSPASARSRATHRNAPFGDRAQHERPGVGPAPVGLEPQKAPGALPPDPRPSSGMSGQVVIPSPDQAKPYTGTPGVARARYARPSADPCNSREPGAARRVPDRGDDLTSCHTRSARCRRVTN
jgi:hypothetical protein